MGRKGIRTLAVLGLLMAAGLAMAAPAEAARYELKATPGNVNLLYTYTYGGQKNDAWYSYPSGNGISPYLMKYDYGKTLDTYGKSKTLVPVGLIRAIRIGDGECVAFAKAMSNTNSITTSHWRRGKKVLDPYSNIQRGTIVAKFNADGTFDCCGTGHVAIFDQYYVTNNGVGFKVWDQNYVEDYLVGKHILMPSGTGVNNANNYYVVEVEP